MAFHFADSASFAANLEGFLLEMEAEDAAMGEILRANISGLLTASDDVSRRAARAEFNDQVKAALDALPNAETDP